MATTLVGSGTLGNVPNATGQCNQNHLVYGVNSGRWFLFVITAADTTHVNCYVSSSNDLSTATWATIGTGTQSPAGTAFVANDARNMAVAYQNIASTDVVHIVTGTSNVSTTAAVQAIRVTVTSSVATWGSWINVAATPTASANTPEGAAIVISTTGRPWLIDSRATQDRDTAGAIATNADAGTSWTSGYGASAVLDNSQANTVNSGAIFQMASGLVVGIVDSGAVTATTTNHAFRKSSSATAWPANSAWSTVGSATGVAQDKNDWGAVGLSTSDVHLVRRTGATAFEHRRYNATSWAAGDTVPSSGLTGHLAGSGVFMATDGTAVWAFIIDTDANKNVKYLKWTSGSGWDASWSTLDTGGDTSTKKFISGYQQAGNSQIGVVWTENTSTPFAIVGSFLSLSVAAANPVFGMDELGQTTSFLSAVLR